MTIISTVAIIVADLSVILGAVYSIWKHFKKFKDETQDKLEKVVEGIKCQHRSEMLRTYYRNKESKTIRQYEFEDFLLHYSSYKALDGNSFIDKIRTEVSEWEIVS